MVVRKATRGDAPRVAAIYNEGIEERIATFETSPRKAGEIRDWFDGTHPVVVVEEEGDRRAGRVAVEPAGSRSPSVSVFPAVSVPESLAACGLALVLCMDP